MLGFGHETVLHVLWYKTLLTCLTSQFFGKTIAFCSSSEGNCVQSEAECYDVKTLICYNQWRQQEHNKCWYKLIIVDLLQRLSIKFLGPPQIFLLTLLWQFTYAALFDSSWFKVPMPLASWLKVSENYGTTSETIAFIKNWNHCFSGSIISSFEVCQFPYLENIKKMHEHVFLYMTIVVVETFNWTKRW